MTNNERERTDASALVVAPASPAEQQKWTSLHVMLSGLSSHRPSAANFSPSAMLWVHVYRLTGDWEALQPAILVLHNTCIEHQAPFHGRQLNTASICNRGCCWTKGTYTWWECESTRRIHSEWWMHAAWWTISPIGEVASQSHTHTHTPELTSSSS